ncbi:acyltransferase [uncultured Bacteroides sp.]|uniref:acyltransferase n=1 Tax=uncultured Bacteroides sp. TaxID=162156 RepID=UPI00280AC098|nr:acyltransferase [uncultured Bacteroides sp.]
MINKLKKILQRHSSKEWIRLFDIKYGLGALENLFASNWFNPFGTLYLNLRSFPLMQAFKMPVFVYGRPHFYSLSGKMIVKGKVTPGMIRFNQTKPAAPSHMGLQSEINNRGTICFHGKGFIGTGNKIFVGFNKILSLGNLFKITDMCNISCYSGISIGAQSWVVHRCQILDSNFHFIANFSQKTIPQYSMPITIGKGCWICNSTTVTGGAVIPDYTIVASNSLVNKNFSNLPANSLIGGIPAAFIKNGICRVDNKNKIKKIFDFYKQNKDALFSIPSNDSPDLYSRINS